MSRPLAVEVVYSPGPGQADRVAVLLEQGATVDTALQASGLLQRHALNAAELEVGVWGRICTLETALRSADRVEIYRPLQVDPKEARRQRHRQQRSAKP